MSEGLRGMVNAKQPTGLLAVSCQVYLSFNVSVTYSFILSIVVRFTPKEFNTAFKDK